MSVARDGGNDPSTEGAEINAPLVFQCKNCNTIVGDTLSFVLADEESKTVTLSAMTKVECIERGLETSKSGRDIGCTFVPVKCTTCGKVLGKVYKTTARAFDNIRDYFTINTEMISSYGLGSADSKAAANASSLDTVTPAVSQLVQQQQTSITKMQQMILLLNERITELEKGVQQQQQQQQSSGSGQKRISSSSSKDAPSSQSGTNGPNISAKKTKP